MKIKSILSAVLMAFVLVACSDSESDFPEINDKDGKSVYLKINTGKPSTLRSDEATATGSSAPLLSAIIYFLDGSADPVVYDVRTVGRNGADITVAQLEEGYQFEGVPSSVTQVYIVGNYNSSDTNGNAAQFPINDGQTLSEIEAVVLNIEQVAHPALTDGTTENYLFTLMDGRATVTEYAGNEAGWNGDDTLSPTDLYANVILIPVNSRLEIVQMSYTGELMSFTLEGIYINNYYQEVPLNLNYTGYAPVNNGSNVNYYDISSDEFRYREYMTLYDIVSIFQGSLTGTATFLPENGTWAYHVFGNTTTIPHIILKFTGLVSASGASIGTRYITVKGFRDQNGTEITSFARNTIYKVTNLEFTDDDLEILPETETISIWVHVEVEEWTTVLVTPII